MRLFDRLRRPAPNPEPVFTVQLHRIIPSSGPAYDGVIANSWSPIAVAGLMAARKKAHELRQSNRWGNAHTWPHVTITDAEGNEVPEWAIRL